MAVLVDFQIRERSQREPGAYGRLAIHPFVDYGDCPKEAISYGLSSAGYDLRVGTTFYIFSNTSNIAVDAKQFSLDNFTRIQTTPGQTVLIPPNCFALAATVEYIEMPVDLVGEIRGKSRLARTGYIMASTPIEPGWRGYITLEIGNLSPLPLRIYAGEGIGQLVFHQLAATPERHYGQKPNARFQDQHGITGPGGTCAERAANGQRLNYPLSVEELEARARQHLLVRE